MNTYSTDRAFTDYVHEHLALPQIYEPMGWCQQWMPEPLQKLLDLEEGVDYLMEDKRGKALRVQERFRDSYAKDYTDCTLRYRRDQNAHEERRASEFFKIQADYLLYGITNGSKFADKRATLTGFLKYAVVDLRVLMQAVQAGQIILQAGGLQSRIEGDKMIAPIIPNRDPSSTFVAFDVLQLRQLFDGEGIILAQQGYW